MITILDLSCHVVTEYLELYLSADRVGRILTMACKRPVWYSTVPYRVQRGVAAELDDNLRVWYIS